MKAPLSLSLSRDEKETGDGQTERAYIGNDQRKRWPKDKVCVNERYVGWPVIDHSCLCSLACQQL